MIRGSLFLALLGACLILDAAPGPSPAQPAGADLLQSLPPKPRRTVYDEVGSEKLTAVTRTNSDEEEVIYEVQSSKDGKSRDLTVAGDGKLLEKQVFIEELPVAVRKAIQTITAGGQLGDITQEFDSIYSETYDVDMTRDTTNREFTVDGDGKLLDMEVFLPETPPSVQRTIQSNTVGATIQDITKSFEQEEVTYDVTMTQGGKTRSFSVSTNGELLQEQVFLDEAPVAVQKAIQAQSARGRLGDINLLTLAGKTNYDVDVVSGRKTVTVRFDAAGALQTEEEDEVLWADLPAEVKRALKPLQGDGEISDITRTTAGTDTRYKIELREGQKRRSLTFKADGAVVP
ncbi:MAG: hypothetical protein ABSA47_08275 [Verrucomicrobiota bacterium]|jgi:uncharacterized membrane protein YkoI